MVTLLQLHRLGVISCNRVRSYPLRFGKQLIPTSCNFTLVNGNAGHYVKERRISTMCRSDQESIFPRPTRTFVLSQRNDIIFRKHNILVPSSQCRRCTSISPTSEERKANLQSDKENTTESLLETWFYEVNPYGSLTANLPFKTVIKSLPPQQYPDMNKVIVQIHYDESAAEESDIPSSHHLAQISELYDLKVSFHKDKAEMQVSCDKVKSLNLPLVCTVQVPLKFGLDLTMQGSSDVFVEKMECESIHIETEKGDCNLRGIKSGTVCVMSKGGNITTMSMLLGNTIFNTGMYGNIAADKIQGSSVICKSEMGSVSLKSLYADTATFETVTGDLSLGHCHAQMYIVGDKSNVSIESLDGDLDLGLHSGSVNAHLMQHKKININLSSGDINLSFPEGSSSDLDLNTKSVDVSKGMTVSFKETELPHHHEGHFGEAGQALVHARTLTGSISLKLLDWIETTKLTFGPKKDLKE